MTYINFVINMYYFILLINWKLQSWVLQSSEGGEERRAHGPVFDTFTDTLEIKLSSDSDNSSFITLSTYALENVGWPI